MEEKKKYKVGDKVSFQPRNPRHPKKCLGVLIKKNPKYSKIRVYVGDVTGVWTVSYNALQPIVEKNEIILLTIGKMEG